MPTWITFNNGAGDLNSNSNIMGSNVASTTKALFGNNEVMQITYSHSTVDGANVGVDLNDDMTLEQNGRKVYTRTVMSEETGESVSVMGENEEVVDYIADHVEFDGVSVNKTNKTSHVTTSGNVKQVSSDDSDEDDEDDGIERDGRYDGRFDNRVDLNEAYNQGYMDGRDSDSSPNVETTTDDSGSSNSRSSSSSNVETTRG